MNKKIGAVALLVLMSLGVGLIPVAIVLGQEVTSFGISILQVTPSSLTGTVGQPVNVQGTIDYSGGPYKVYFGTAVVASGTAEGYYVNANFTVPQIPAGGYSLTLLDVTAKENSSASSPETFQVTIGYSISAVPSQAQEGSSVALNFSVTGGTPTRAYDANVTVALPSPLNTTEYSQMVSLETNQEGTAIAQVTYPGSGFQPSGNTTDYAGTYDAYFNQSTSASLAQTTFFIGFLNSTTYHRRDTVTIGAIGYQSNQAATLSITNKTGATIYSNPSLTASASGVINATWVVPQNMVIGHYNVTITPTGTQKAIKDVETFSVPGYPIQVETVNLAGELVPQIQIQALDQSSGTVYKASSGLYGIADLNLETGVCSLTAFWNGVNVGETTITVTGSASLTMTCTLTDLKITVQNENGTAMPFVNLAIVYQYQPTSGGSSQTGNVSGQTGPSGTYFLNSTLTGVKYTIQASIDSQVFNSGNETVSLPAQAISYVLIVCPTEKLTINVVGYNNEPISGASLDLVELTNGLFYTSTTDSSGSATAPVTFGVYKLQIYENSILLNQTTVEVFSDSEYNIRCTIYGIQVSVSVVDYFGQAISNANVTVNGPALERLSAMTQGDGIATFNNIIGGNLQIVAFPPGQESNYQAVSLTVDKPTTVQIRMDGYIVLGSFLIQTSALLTIIIILVAVILLVAVEIYWRRRHRASGT